ncbi:MAG TPA: tape measure protein, partial [Intrasporangiaceae bacterium]|nr:tape measure protein [Intrasporangiaceae bacterium]
MSERRTISVILRAQTDDFAREMGKASKSLDELVRKEDKHGTVAQSTAGRIVQSARLQADAWGQVGSTMLGAGAALSGMSIAVAKTGIEYNTLQQTSRAALRAILGGAEQANAQMDKLDAFARTSPFSKSVFIQAQQQMLGFGIEARKVVPYLSAINEAVAATGGSNQDIAELTRIFSQVRAASKITATDLMQFGQRGVDAAALIGSQMGKTGAQIRDEITAGTLGADEALDALAAGMQQRFEGASAGVKNTMSGAIDRIKAAWRDLSSAVMEPAVGREGGGFLVGAANGVADFLRVIEKMPAPIRDSGAALTALSGVGLTAFGAFAMGLPRILETVRAFRELSAAVPALSMGMRLLGAGTLAAFGAIGIAAAAVALSMGSIQQQQAEAKSRVEAFTSAMQGQTDALNENVRAVAAKQLADAGAFDAARTLGLSLQLVTDAALGNESALARVSAEMERQQGAAREAVTNASRHGESL